jgi:hypothetical protein
MVRKIAFVGQNIAFAIMGILLLSMVLLPVSAYALRAGDKTPDFHIITHQGKEISYDKDIKGKKPVYLFFWTTW